MLVKVQKWGSSLAVRIPKALAEEAGLEVGIEVELRAEDGRLHVVHQHKPHYTLEELVAQITPENRHGKLTGVHLLATRSGSGLYTRSQP